MLSETEGYNSGLPMPAFPPLPGSCEAPVWTGDGFRVGGRVERVLAYDVGESGWTDALTEFHEEVAEAGNHAIDVASRRYAVESLARSVRSGAPVLMDIGCSSGYLLRDLRERFPQATILGADYVRGPLERLAQTMSGVPLLQFDLVHCPLPDACLDAVALLNVLEHIEDDAGAARQIHRILKPGGVAAIEVPAGPHLYDVYDRHLMHHRRYTLSQMRRMLEQAGFAIERASHLGCLLYPAFRMVKMRNRRYLDSPGEEQRRVVARSITQSGENPLTRAALKAETTLGRWVRYPVGIRCVLTCRKGQ